MEISISHATEDEKVIDNKLHSIFTISNLNFKKYSACMYTTHARTQHLYRPKKFLISFLFSLSHSIAFCMCVNRHQHIHTKALWNMLSKHICLCVCVCVCLCSIFCHTIHQCILLGYICMRLSVKRSQRYNIRTRINMCIQLSRTKP